jgi:hypothetical protein
MDSRLPEVRSHRVEESGRGNRRTPSPASSHLLSRTVETPRHLVTRAITTLRTTFGERLTSVVLAGSVAKNDWVPFWSDLDLHAFVADLASVRVTAHDAVTLQRDLGPLVRDLYQLATIQVLLFDATGYPKTFVSPVPGTFEIVYGTPPEGACTDEEIYYAHAHNLLGSLRTRVTRVAANFASATDDELPAVVRQLSGLVKDGLYATAAVVSERPTLGLALHRDELISTVARHVDDQVSLAVFYRLAGDWRTVRREGDALRQMFTAGCEAVGSITRWYGTYHDRRLMGMKIAQIRMSKHLTQEGLVGHCMQRGKDISVRTIEAIESATRPYELPRKIQSRPLKLELVAEALETDLADLLRWRSDDEIAASCFSHLLADIRRRRAHVSN